MSWYWIYTVGLDQHNNSRCHCVVYIQLDWINILTQDVMLLYIYTVGLDQHTNSRCHVIVYILLDWINIMSQYVMLLYIYS